MTCIVGLIDSGKIVIGADTRVTMGGHICNAICNKLIEKKPDVIMGICGYVRFADIIRSKFEMPPRVEGRTDIEYLQVDFVNALRTCLEEVKMAPIRDGVSTMPESAMLMVYRNKIFSVSEDYSIIEYLGFGADGSGADYALGSLETTRELDMTPKERVETALDVACKFNAYCAPPYNIIEKDVHVT